MRHEQGQAQVRSNALKTARQRVQEARAGQPGSAAQIFSEAEAPLLLKLARVDLIKLIEVDMRLGPLTTSQKNSVASMVEWLMRCAGRRWAWWCRALCSRH
jgi:hypothetical protein